MHFLGVDGGGTKTAAVLISIGMRSKVLSIMAGAGNIATIGRQGVESLIRELLHRLNIADRLNDISWATFAFAGAGRIRERKMTREIITALGMSNFTVMTDAEILHYSVFGSQQGIMLAGGAGSVCVVKNDDDSYRQIGGWGYLLGDEGGGFHIGKQAIRAALRDAEHGPRESRLTQRLLKFYDADTPLDLVGLVGSAANHQNRIASCAALVAELAEQGDAAANQIIDAAVEEFLQLIRRATEIANLQAPIGIALCGSVLQPSAIVGKRLRERVHGSEPQMEFHQQDVHPAAASAMHAMKMCGQEIDDELLADLRQLTF